jgi:protein gp37
MAVAERHTFQLLTKRHARMRAVLSTPGFWERVARASGRLMGDGDTWCDYVMLGPNWPLPNVWGGVSVEDQKWADIRIPALLDTPLAVRWISAEPLLGALDVTDYLSCQDDRLGHECSGCWLDWVVVGGESGPGARPMHPAWARQLRDQCEAAGVPFLFKQWGA